MKDICKVGLTSKTLNDRLKGLNNTSVASCFKLEYYIEVNSDERFKIEKNIHNDIVTNSYDRMPGKEFFKCNPSDIIKIFEKYGEVKYEEEVNENVMVGGKKKKIDGVKSVEIFKCPHCNKYFKTTKYVNNHIKTSCKMMKEINNNKLIINKLNEIFDNKIIDNIKQISEILGNEYENTIKLNILNMCLNKIEFSDIHDIIESDIKSYSEKKVIDNLCPYCNTIFQNESDINNHIKFKCILKDKLDYNVNAIIIVIGNMVNEYNNLLYFKNNPHF
jgi:uncharacterized C2H2 Zn-finger protein